MSKGRLKEIELDLDFIEKYWNDTYEKLEKLYDNGYRKVVIHVLDVDNLDYEQLAEEAQFHGFWLKVIVTGGKRMRTFVRHTKPEEIEVLSDKKGKMKKLLLKKAYIKTGKTWVNSRAEGFEC
jgi:peptidyl-tRNA hydrolase